MVLSLLSTPHREPAECIIRLGASGQEITELYPYLTAVTVDSARRQASVATLQFESRRDENGVWSVQDRSELRPWERIVIEAAFGSTTEDVFRGYVREMRAEYPENPGQATVRLECQDASLRMDRQHVRRSWGGDAPTSDAAIFAEIARRHNLRPHANNGPGQTGLVLNQDSTDIRFLRDRATANAYELIFYPDSVYFGPMRLEAPSQGTMLVYAGADTHCYRFSVRADGHQPDSVLFQVAAAEGTEVVQREVGPNLRPLGTEPADSSSSGLGDFRWLMSRHGSASEEELAGRAQVLANEASLRIKAEGELDGSRYGQVLRVGEPVGVDGVGNRLAGIYYVDTVKHEFDVNGYRQQFRLLRNAYGDNLEAGGSGLPIP